MTIPTFDEGRAAAIRDGLAALASTAPRRKLRSRLRLTVAAIALGSALAGSAVSAAVAINLRPVVANPAPAPGQPAPSAAEGNPGIAAPPGTIPGAPVISLLGDLSSQVVSGDAELQLEPPAEATHVRVTLACLTPGLTSWGLESAADRNPSSSCSANDVVREQPTWMDFTVTDPATLHVSSAPDTSSIVSYQFVTHVETAWGVNERGMTFGVSKPGFGEPDLISAETTDGVQGYVNADELAAADGSATAGTLKSPKEALEWQEARKGQQISIPVYKSDGTSILGEFVIQG